MKPEARNLKPETFKAAAVGLLLVAIALCPLTSARAELGEGIGIGYMTLSPFVEVNGTYDSNVYLDHTNQQDDIFFEGMAGVEMHYMPKPFTLDGRGWVVFRRYTDFLDQDFNNYGERLSLNSGEMEALNVTVFQSYRVINDYDRSSYYGESMSPEVQNLSLTYDRSMRLRRNLNDVGVVLGRDITERSEGRLGVSYSSEDYDEPTLYDGQNISLDGDVALRLTDKSSGFVTFRYGMEANDSFADDAISKTLSGGLATKTTEKVTFRGAGGVQVYTRSEPKAGSGAGVPTLGLSDTQQSGGDDVAFHYEVAGTWIATEKISFEVAGHNQIEAASQYANTANSMGTLSINCVYQYNDSLSAALTGSWRRDDYLDPVEEQGQVYDRLDDRYAGLARLSYAPPMRFMTIFGEVGYEDAQSTVPVYNYDQLRVSLGVALRY